MTIADRRNVSGGRAGGGGYDYQAEAYALIAAKMLARESLIWADTGCNRVPIAIQMETGTGGDDLRIQLESGNTVEIQAKRGLQRGADFWMALLQLASAISRENRVHGVLLTNSAASGTISSDLRQAIIRVGQGRTDNLPVIASELVGKLVDAQKDPVEICSRLRIIVRDFDQGAQGEQETLTAIERILADPAQAGAARSVLVANGLDLIQLRGGSDGAKLARLLRQQGIRLAPGSSNLVLLREAYIEWMVRTNSAIVIPTLKTSLPISSAWVKLRAMDVDEREEVTPKSLNEQIAEYHEWHRLADNRRDNQIFDIEIATKRERCLVVVGGPGTGKSTLLRKLAHSLSIAGQLALRVSLRAVSLLIDEGKTFDDAMVLAGSDGFASSSNAASQMLREAQILLADGLDETDPNRAHVAEKLHNWVEASPSRKLIVTTRPIGHDPAWFHGWKHLELLPLGSEDIEKYAAQVFGLLFHNDVEAERRSQGFAETLKSSRTATIAARNPQLLGFLIALHVGGSEITGKRSAIFRSILELSRTQSHSDRRFQRVVEQGVAYRALEFIGWTLLSEPAIPARSLVERIGHLFEQETGKPRLAAQDLVEQALEFWVERGILERIGVGLHTAVTFVHMNLRDFVVAQHLRSMDESQFVSWLLASYRDIQFREVILLTGGTDRLGLSVATLLEMDDPNDPISTVALLAADVVGEAESLPTETTHLVIEHLAPHIESTIPMVAYETGDRLQSLAVLAPDLIGPLALNLQQHDQKWTREVGCALGLLTDPQQYVDKPAVVDAFASASDSGMSFGRRGSGLNLHPRAICKELIVHGAHYLLSDTATSEDIEVVKTKFRARDHSVGTHEELERQLIKRLGRLAVWDLQSNLYDAVASFSVRSLGWKRDFKSYSVLLEAVMQACDGMAESSLTRDPEPIRDAIARIYAMLKIAESPVTEFFAIGDHGDDVALVEVMRGVMLVGEIDPCQAKVEAVQTLADLQPPEDSEEDYYPNLRFHSLIKDSEELLYVAEPAWDRCSSQQLNLQLLIRALEHPSVNIAFFAANLLWRCFDHELLSIELKTSLSTERSHALSILAQMALELWPVEGCDLILDRLEIAIDENCAPLIAALAEVRTETRDERIRSVLKQALEVRQVGVVKSTLKAIEALGYDDLHSDVLTCYRWWLTDGPQYPGPDDKIQIVEPNVAADILAHLSHAGKITMDDLHEACNSSRSDVRRVATQEIARMLDANDEWIESILDDIQAGQLPSGVLDELSRCYPQVCKRYEPTIMALLTSPDEVIRITVIRALGDGWCDDATAITTLRTMLNDVDIEVRDEATTILRELLNEPRIDD